MALDRAGRVQAGTDVLVGQPLAEQAGTSSSRAVSPNARSDAEDATSSALRLGTGAPAFRSNDRQAGASRSSPLRSKNPQGIREPGHRVAPPVGQRRLGDQAVGAVPEPRHVRQRLVAPPEQAERVDIAPLPARTASAWRRKRARKCTGSCAGQWSMSPSSTASTRASSPAAGPVAWSPDACGNATAARSRWRRAAARSSSTNASRTRANSAMTSKSLSPCSLASARHRSSSVRRPARAWATASNASAAASGAEPVAPRQLGGARATARLGSGSSPMASAAEICTSSTATVESAPSARASSRACSKRSRPPPRSRSMVSSCRLARATRRVRAHRRSRRRVRTRPRRVESLPFEPADDLQRLARHLRESSRSATPRAPRQHHRSRARRMIATWAATTSMRARSPSSARSAASADARARRSSASAQRVPATSARARRRCASARRWASAAPLPS